MPCLGTTETIQRVRLLDGTSITERTIPVIGNPFKYHCRLFAPVLSAGAGSFFDEDSFAAGKFQRIGLQAGVLVEGGDTSISDEHGVLESCSLKVIFE